MNTRRDEKWLDGELRRAIDTGKLEFDAEAWKRKHAGAYAVLTSRARTRHDTRARMGRRVWLIPGTLAAAVILIVVAFLLTRMPPNAQEPEAGTSARAISPANIVSMMSLRMAYRHGGEEALNRQLDKALKTLGPRPDALLTLQVLRDLNG